MATVKNVDPQERPLPLSTGRSLPFGEEADVDTELQPQADLIERNLLKIVDPDAEPPAPEDPYGSRARRVFAKSGSPTVWDEGDLHIDEATQSIKKKTSEGTATVLGPVVSTTDIGETVPPVVDEINRFYPFNTASGIGSSSSGGGWSGSQMPHNNASTYPWVVVPVRFPEHWQTCAVDAFWFTPTSGLTGGPTLQVAKLEHDPEGGGLVSASFTASSNVVVGSAALTQYQIYKTTLVSNLVCDPTKLTHLRALRVSLNASADGLAGTIALHRVRLTRAT